ncbi:hypothetical protein K1719_007485 [Acacia pycnantha]|nr:hypothetical protein K1719_007485 [Acacia pycnantha]
MDRTERFFFPGQDKMFDNVKEAGCGRHLLARWIFATTFSTNVETQTKLATRSARWLHIGGFLNDFSLKRCLIASIVRLDALGPLLPIINDGVEV